MPYVKTKMHTISSERDMQRNDHVNLYALDGINLWPYLPKNSEEGWALLTLAETHLF
jgi:hypothetical protein